MTNIRTLYDILQVPRNASTDDISNAFEFLRSAYEAGRLKSDNLDPSARFNLIKDAYRTLASNELRARYDARLRENEALRQGRNQDSDFSNEDTGGNWWKWAYILLVLIAAGGYYHIHESSKAKMQRLELEAEQARAQAAELAQEQDERDKQERSAQDHSAQLLEQAAAARRQNEAIRYSDSIQRNLVAAEAQAAREDARQRSLQEMQQRRLQQRQTIEGTQRAAVERNQLRQIESRPQKAGIIASPQSSHSSLGY